MSTQYSLNVVNHSTQFQTVCVLRSTNQQGTVTVLAWRVTQLFPNTTATFDWTNDDEAITWMIASAEVTPGEVVDPEQLTNAVALPFTKDPSLEATLDERGLWSVRAL